MGVRVSMEELYKAVGERAALRLSSVESPWNRSLSSALLQGIGLVEKGEGIGCPRGLKLGERGSRVALSLGVLLEDVGQVVDEDGEAALVLGEVITPVELLDPLAEKHGGVDGGGGLGGGERGRYGRG